MSRCERAVPGAILVLGILGLPSIYLSGQVHEKLETLEARARSGELVAIPFKGSEQEKEAAVSKACKDIYDDWRAILVFDGNGQKSCERGLWAALDTAATNEKVRKLAKEMNVSEEVARAGLYEAEANARAKAAAEFKAQKKAVADRIEAGEGGKPAGAGAK